MSGTDRGVWWLAIIYGLSIASVVTLARRGGSGQHDALGGSVALAGVASVVAVPLLIVGPLHHVAAALEREEHQRDADRQVIRNGTNLTQIVSFVGQAEKPQKLLVRADLLVATRGSRTRRSSSSTCRAGTSAAARSRTSAATHFTGTCRMPNGESRSVNASWEPTAQATA